MVAQTGIFAPKYYPQAKQLEIDFENTGEVQEFDLRLDLKDGLVTGFEDCL